MHCDFSLVAAETEACSETSVKASGVSVRDKPSQGPCAYVVGLGLVPPFPWLNIAKASDQTLSTIDCKCFYTITD